MQQVFTATAHVQPHTQQRQMLIQQVARHHMDCVDIMPKRWTMYIQMRQMGHYI